MLISSPAISMKSADQSSGCQHAVRVKDPASQICKALHRHCVPELKTDCMGHFGSPVLAGFEDGQWRQPLRPAKDALLPGRC